MQRLQGLVESGVISASQLIHNFNGRIISGTLSWAGATVGMKCYLRDGRDASAPAVVVFVVPTANGTIPLSYLYGKEFQTAIFFDEGDLVSPAANVFIEVTFKPYMGSVDRKAQYYMEFDSVNSAIKASNPRIGINAYDPAVVSAPFTVIGKVFARTAGEGTLGTMVYKDESTGPSVVSAGYKVHVFSLSGGFLKIGFNVRHGSGVDATRLTVSTADRLVPQNAWCDICCVYNRNGDHSGEAWVNGVQCQNTDQPPGTANGVSFPVDDLRDDSNIPLYIGNRHVGDATWDGFIRNIAFFHNKALSAQEIMDHYNGLEVPGKTANFKFLEGQGTKVADVLGGHVGVIGKVTGANTFVEDAAKARWGKYSDLPLVAGS